MITGGEVDIGIMVTMMMNMIVVIIEADIEGVDGIKRMMVEEMVSGGVEEDKKGVAERADGIGRTEIVEIMTAGIEIGMRMTAEMGDRKMRVGTPIFGQKQLQSLLQQVETLTMIMLNMLMMLLLLLELKPSLAKM